MDLTVTAANVLASAVPYAKHGIAGAAITAGQALYIDTTDSNKLKLADANGTAPANTYAGIALHAAAIGQPIAYQNSDPSFTTGFTALAGDPIFLSDNAGGVTKTIADLASGSAVIQVGLMLTTTQMNMSSITGGNIA